jgi:hypothetical protein
MASLRNTHLYGRHLVLEWAKEGDDQEGELDGLDAAQRWSEAEGRRWQQPCAGARHGAGPAAEEGPTGRARHPAAAERSAGEQRGGAGPAGGRERRRWFGRRVSARCRRIVQDAVDVVSTEKLMENTADFQSFELAVRGCATYTVLQF